MFVQISHSTFLNFFFNILPKPIFKSTQYVETPILPHLELNPLNTGHKNTCLINQLNTFKNFKIRTQSTSLEHLNSLFTFHKINKNGHPTNNYESTVFDFWQ